MDTYSEDKKAVIEELRRLVESYSKNGETPPSAIGGPFQLNLQQMILEIENDTEIGRTIVKSFADLKRDFPSS